MDPIETPLKKKKNTKKILSIFLFLPLIILVSSDAALLLTNQVQVVIEFNSSLGFIGAIIAVSLVAKAISTIISGYASDKYSRKIILICGGSAWFIAEILIYFSVNEYMLMFLRVIASIGAGSLTPVTMSLLADIFSTEKRGNSFAWWGIATMVGEVGGGSIGLAFNPIQGVEYPAWIATLEDKINYIATTYPFEEITMWRTPFLIMGVLGAIFVVLIFLVKEPKRGASEEKLRDVLADENVDYSNNYKIKIEDLKYIYTRKSNFWLIINFVDTILSGLLLAYLITWLTVEVEVSFTLASIPIILPLLIPLIICLVFGQFIAAKIGDNKYNKGDYAGRVKVAIFCGVAQIPFLILGFFFAPNVANLTFFRGALDLSGNIAIFLVVLLLMGVVLGLGVGLWLGVGPLWYASMLDVNLPEHRGTMIATAAFMDAIGRAIGSWLGGSIINVYQGTSITPITDTIMLIVLTIGTLSALLWLPILKYCKKDFKEVADILDERAEILKNKKTEK